LGHGTIGPAGDVDFYRIDVPLAGSSLRIETFDSAGPVTCAAIDTLVELRAADGTPILASDDDSGPGNCSFIDGTAALSGAHNVAAGTYYVRVRLYDALLTGAYTLRITIIPPPVC